MVEKTHRRPSKSVIRGWSGRMRHSLRTRGPEIEDRRFGVLVRRATCLMLENVYGLCYQMPYELRLLLSLMRNYHVTMRQYLCTLWVASTQVGIKYHYHTIELN